MYVYGPQLEKSEKHEELLITRRMVASVFLSITHVPVIILNPGINLLKSTISCKLGARSSAPFLDEDTRPGEER